MHKLTSTYLNNTPSVIIAPNLNIADSNIVGLEQERTISQILSKMSYWLHLDEHLKLYLRKIPWSKSAPFTPILSVQKLSLLHQIGYRRFPLEQERTRCSWCSGCSERPVNALTATTH